MSFLELSQPQNWQKKRIKNISKLKSGSTPLRSKHERYFLNGKIPWVKTLDLTNGKINTTDERITEIALKETSCSILQPGTVLIAMYGGYNQIGRTGLLTIQGTTNQAITALDINQSIANPEYVLHWLNANISLWRRFAASSRKDPNITKQDVGDFPILIPPLAEQRKIAEVLGTWDEAIEKTERLIAALERRKKGLMQRLLTGQVRFPGFEGEWREVRLNSIAKVIMGQSPSSNAYNTNQEGLPLIQGNADIVARKTSPKVFTSEITKQCRKGDVILSVRAPVGETALAIHNACIGRGVCSIRAEKCNPTFLYHQLVFEEDKWQRFAQGSTFTAINSTDIKNFELLIPKSINEQKFIANIFENLDNQISIYKTILNELINQKKGLMQRLLTGQVRVQVELDQPL